MLESQKLVGSGTRATRAVAAPMVTCCLRESVNSAVVV